MKLNLFLMSCLIIFIFNLQFSNNQVYAAIPPLPEPTANNAVALVKTDEEEWLVSFMGLGPGKDWQDVHNKVWAYSLSTGSSKRNVSEESVSKMNVSKGHVSKKNQWQIRKPVPSSLALKGRLAAIAVGLNGKAWLFGGYTVAEDHTEISSPDNFAYDVQKDEYQQIKAMPVPVDDAVALAYQNRYIYLISGWHNDGNVNLTQVYDTQTDSWAQASPFLGKPVFGQSGGIVANQLLICDGVKVVPQPDKRRTFDSEAACYSGTISPNNYLKIDWLTVSHPTGTARYRMAAKGVTWQRHSGILFIGGSVNPYNYNGIGYDGNASVPDEKIWFYDFAQQQWLITKNDSPTMDHRGLLETEEHLLIIGGIATKQVVLKEITHFNKSRLLSSIIKD